MKATLILFTALFSINCFFHKINAQQILAANIERGNSFLKKTENISGVDVIRKNIAVLGGMEQLETIQSLDFQGTLEISGMQLNFSERKENPNLDYIALSIDEDTIMRTVFDGKMGYNQDIGKKIFLSAEEIRERNMDNLGLFNQIYYLDSSKSFFLNDISQISSNDSSFYKLDIRMPSGKTILEYYDAKTYLLVKSTETEILNGDTIVTSKSFCSYKKINGVTLPCKINIVKSKNGQDQVITILINSFQINLPTE